MSEQYNLISDKLSKLSIQKNDINVNKNNSSILKNINLKTQKNVNISSDINKIVEKIPDVSFINKFSTINANINKKGSDNIVNKLDVNDVSGVSGVSGENTIKNFSLNGKNEINNNNNNFFSFIKKYFSSIFIKLPKIFNSFVVNSQTFITSLIVLIIVIAICYLIYRLYLKHPRPFTLSKALPIASSNESPKSLDILFYSNLSKGLAHYIFRHDLVLHPGILKGYTKYQKSILKEINNRIFFHKKTNSYKKLTNFFEKYNDKIYNPKWIDNSMKGYQNFFFDILVNQNLAFTELKRELILLLNKYNNEFKQNFDYILNNNIFSFINANHYINNSPLDDYILHTYGKHIQIDIKGGPKYLTDIFRFDSNSTLKELLSNHSDNLIDSTIKNLNNQFDQIFNQPIFSYIFTVLKLDSSDFLQYRQFIHDYGTSNNDFINSLEKLSNKKNEQINLTLQSKYNIEIANVNRKYILTIYQDLIVLLHFRNIISSFNKIINNKKNQKLLLSSFYWHLERLQYSQFYDGNSIVYVLNPDFQKRFSGIIEHIFELINYPLYKVDMGYGLFVVLYLYLSDPVDIKENLQFFSDYYLSFSEIYLGLTHLNEFENIKNKRDNINVFNDFFLPAVKFYFRDIIWQKQIKDVLFTDYRKVVSPYWNSMRIKLGNGSTYFNCNDKIIRGALKSVCTKKEKFENNDEFNGGSNENNESNEKEVVEHFSLNPFKFLGDIVKAVINIGKFFISIMQHMGEIIGLVMSIFNIATSMLSLITHFDKFMETLIGFIIWIFGSIILILLKIKFGSYTLGHYLVSLLYRILYLLPIALYNSSVFFILLLIRFILTMIIVIGDSLTNNKASKFFYKWFLACENSPFSFYEDNFFHKDNINIKNLVCYTKCLEGYKVSEDGTSCEKIPDYLPRYCPTANLMRIYRGLKIKGTSQFKPFSMPNNLNDKEKEEYINEFKKNKKDFHESCQRSSISNYDSISKFICSNYEFTNNSSNNEINNICYNEYCTNGKNESFCTKIKNNKVATVNNPSKTSIIKIISSIALIIITLIIIILTIHNSLSKN